MSYRFTSICGAVFLCFGFQVLIAIFAERKIDGYEETGMDIGFGGFCGLSESGTCGDKNDGGRGTEKEVSDTIDVDVDAVPDGWAGSIDVGFEFG